MPGAPPLGAVLDFAVYFWCIIISIMHILYISCKFYSILFSSILFLSFIWFIWTNKDVFLFVQIMMHFFICVVWQIKHIIWVYFVYIMAILSHHFFCHYGTITCMKIFNLVSYDMFILFDYVYFFIFLYLYFCFHISTFSFLHIKFSIPLCIILFEFITLVIFLLFLLILKSSLDGSHLH